MSELMSQLITPEVQQTIAIIIAMLVILYALVVVWVARDAYRRGTNWWAWALVSLVPVVGVIAYCMLRPPLLQIDRDEQELEVTLKQRELMKYGECANCGYPVEADYVVCPNCHQRLKNLCSNCGHALDPSWTICPYCGSPAGAKKQSHASASTRSRRTSSASQQTRQQQPRQPRTSQRPSEPQH